MRSPAERLIYDKGIAFKNAIENFAHRDNELRQQANKIIREASVGVSLPSPISTKVWLLRDGGVVVRYLDWREQPRFDWVISDVSVIEWVFSVPTERGEVSLKGLRFQIGSSLITETLRITNPNLDLTVKHVRVMTFSYSDTRLQDTEKLAVMDFRLTFLGHIFQEQGLLSTLRPELQKPKDESKESLAILEERINRFENLLKSATKEEEVQSFLKANPFLLGQTAEIIPKKKLGEDFVTDFMMVNMLAQGHEYTLVEIERPDRKLFKKNGDPHADLTHAEKQTLDWDVWLEKNKAYLQSKFPRFETPQYLIIIGRITELDEANKAILRARNRDSKNRKIVTYDDLLAHNKTLLKGLREMVGGAGVVDWE